MTLIVDASVVTKFSIIEEGHREAVSLFDRGADIEAPDLVLTELANVLWKKAVRGEVSADHARRFLAYAPSYFSALHASAGLIQRAFEIACDLKHPVYDCLYIACAEAQDAILVTDDRRLLRVLQNGPLTIQAEALSEAGTGAGA